MAKPNAQLEAAINQFSAQPGVTPDQAAQLRASITSDGELLTNLNQDAAGGQLKAFALDTSGSGPNIVGRYDEQRGVVTLPSLAFQSNSPAATSSLSGALRIQDISLRFAHGDYPDASNTGVRHQVTQEMVDNLQSTINGSPVLAEQMREAVTVRDKSGRHPLESFAILDPQMGAGGTYNGGTKTMSLPAPGLQTRGGANPMGRFDSQDMTFVLAHEVQHGFNSDGKNAATATFLKAVSAEAAKSAPFHDYTAPIVAYTQAGREDEAKAEIAGWNALLSREKQLNRAANLDEMLATRNDRVRDFVQQDPNVSQPKAMKLAGLNFKGDGTLEPTPGNVAAMGQHYFDRPAPGYAQPGQRPVHIGEHKPASSDYPNYYGNWALERIFEAENRSNKLHQGAKPVVMVNMAAAGLKEDLQEMEGLDLGTNKAARHYLDSSQSPPMLRKFDHTQDGSVNPSHTYVQIDAQAEQHASGPSTVPRTPDDAGHPDHQMLVQIRDGITKVEAHRGRAYDDFSERVSRSLLAECKDQRDAYPHTRNEPLSGREMAQVDHVVMGPSGRVFAVEGKLQDPAHRRASVDFDRAAQIPLEVSDQKLDAANQQILREHETVRQQELSRSQDDPTRSGPTR